MDVLKLLNLLNLMFKKQDSNLGTALSSLRLVRKEVDNLLLKCTAEHITWIVYPQNASITDDGPPLPAKRKRAVPVAFQEDSIVKEKLTTF